MTKFNFKGDLQSVREKQLNFISKMLESRGFTECEVLIENVGAAGDGFIANVKRVVVNENGETFKMIAKIAPDQDIMRYMTQIEVLFKNEHVIYTELLPKFTQMQKDAGVSDRDLLKYASCYGSFSEAPDELILLEDLNESQYNMLDKFEPLSYECVKLVLKNFAVYHSLSFVLKHQEPETFEAIASKFGDMLDGPVSNLKEGHFYFEETEASAIKCLDNDKYRNVVKGSVSNFLTLHKEIMVKDANSPFLVIQQGDAWTNNLMFQFKEELPINCVMIDYQMVKANNLVYDIMYMLFNSTTHEHRMEHYHEYIDYYHDELDKSLQNYGLKASDVYPRKQLDFDLKEYGKVMFATSIHVTTFITKKSEDAAKLKDAIEVTSLDNINDVTKTMLDLDPETIALVKNKIEGLVDSFVELELLLRNLYVYFIYR